MDRRRFFKVLSAGGLGLAFSPVTKASGFTKLVNLEKDIPATNIADALAVPRNDRSMPGIYPGKVVRVKHARCIENGQPQEAAAYDMLKMSMLTLTNETDLKNAWLQFVQPEDIIGLKVNPIGGKLLSTSHALVRAVIRQLEEAGISKQKLLIWDRREEDLKNAGFTAENYPGIRIESTEYQDENGSFYDSDGKLYGESRIDREHYFYADVEGEYDAYTLPYMVNEGKYSYFSKICTKGVTKIINLPVLKNAGPTVTLCLKNMAFGSISNTARLHQQLWHETCAYVNAFPCIRDKVVLHIADGIKGCFDGGPAANPQFICQYNLLLVGSDPVAVDRVGHEIVVEKRIEEGVQESDKPGADRFIRLAADLKLGVSAKEKISLLDVEC